MKQIPIALRNHLAQPATSWCLIMRVACVGRWAGTVLGFADLDESILYDDGAGPVLYRCDNGFAPERLQHTADMSVDNTDLVGWVQDTGITEQQILAGIFDFAECAIYRVNYLDLSQRHEVVAFGSLGRTQFTANQWRVEFRSLMQMARQPQSAVYSLTCRATYGDERCGLSLAWVPGTVASVGDDDSRMFTWPAGKPDDHYNPGVVEWLTGDNAGAQMEVDDQAGDDFRLALPMPFPIQPGDTFRIRIDCDKHAATCKARGNFLNFRAEPLTPVSDSGLSVPGAYIKSVDAK